MQRVIALMLFFIFTSVPGAGAEEIIKQGETLDLKRCIEIGLMRHPNILAATGTVDAGRSRVGQSQANYYPQVNLSSGYSRISPLSGGDDTGSTISSSGNGGSHDQYSSSVSLNQNIYDFGKTPLQVRISRFNLDSSRLDLENIQDVIVQNVKLAYFGVLQAKRNRDVSADTVKQFELHLEQAKGFFEVGTHPKFDVTKAEVDLSNARLNLIRADNSLKIAIVSLNNAMGLPGAPAYEIEDNLSFQKYDMTLETAFATAFENRPDLLSSSARKQAAESSIDLAKTNYYPFITGSAAYNWEGRSFPLEHGWSVGATLSFPVFSGFLTRYQVAEAKANLNVAAANEELLRQTITLDVQQAYLNLKAAEDSIPAAELTVKQATENLEIANGRYTAGVGNPIEVTDAEVSLLNAKTAYIQTLYDYKIAQANLEKAMGVK